MNQDNTTNKKITSIAVNLNQICNLDCVYCYRHVRGAHAREMPDTVLEQTVKFIQELKPEQVSFPQREPTMSFPKLKRMVEMLGDGYKYHITTNGYALTKEMVEFLKAHNFGVLISYDSVMQSQRPTVDGFDSNPFVRQSCKMLLEADTNPTCLILVTEQDLPYLEEMLEDVINLGFKNVFLNRDTQVNSSTCVKSVKLFEEKMHACKEIGQKAGVSLGPFFRMEQKGKKGVVKTNPCDFMCGAGKGGIAIDPDGMLYPCHHTNAWAEMGRDIGSVFTGIDWEKKSQYRQSGPCGEQLEKCQACGSTLCGMCYLDNHENTGNMITPHPLSCEIQLALYRAADIPLKPQPKPQPQHQRTPAPINRCSVRPAGFQKAVGEVIAVHPGGLYDVQLPNGQVLKGLMESG